MWVRGRRVQGPCCPKSCSIHPIPQDNKDPCSIIMLCLSGSKIHPSSCLTPPSSPGSWNRSQEQIMLRERSCWLLDLSFDGLSYFCLAHGHRTHDLLF